MEDWGPPPPAPAQCWGTHRIIGKASCQEEPLVQGFLQPIRALGWGFGSDFDSLNLWCLRFLSKRNLASSLTRSVGTCQIPVVSQTSSPTSAPSHLYAKPSTAALAWRVRSSSGTLCTHRGHRTEPLWPAEPQRLCCCCGAQPFGFQLGPLSARPPLH